MRIVALSDTHGLHEQLVVPDGDILVHAGDLTGHGTQEELEAFNRWLGTLPHPHKLVIAGNHDWVCAEQPWLIHELLSNATHLCDTQVTVGGLRCYGSPWQLQTKASRQRNQREVNLMDDICTECGAPVRAGATCLDHFHALLVLEGSFPGAPGSILHFYAVATYNLQHPDSVGLTTEALEGLRRNLADALDGKATVAELRRRARRDTDGPTRVRRRPGDPPVEWYRAPWPVNVTDVLSATAATYPDLVEAWARGVSLALTAHFGEATPVRRR